MNTPLNDAATTAAAGAEPERRVIQRVILPSTATPDIVSLYVDQKAARSFGSTAMVGAGRGSGEDSAAAESAPETSPTKSAGASVDASELSDRYGLRMPGRSLRSFGTYFNAFPAAYWRRWTPVRSVRLSIRTAGPGQIVVYRSNARGAVQREEHALVSGETETVFDLPLTAFGDGGWYWFDLHSGAKALTLVGAEWTAEASLARTRGTLSLAMTTMNKVPYCLENIRTIADCAPLRERLDVFYVVDQGSDRLTDHPDELGPLQAQLGDQLQVVEQGNIGGSGGFSRGMYETVRAGRSTYVVNCDDDVVIETESLLRMLEFADYATTPTLVGAHMFDLNNRSVLYSFGEAVNLYSFMWGLSLPGSEYGHDFSTAPLGSTPWLHRRVDVDYNGWWMCLIPVETVRSIGLSLPVFIKWDDAEYGLRARKAGYPTVSLPGAGIWHISWADKDDAVDWQAYFHERNRMIAALLHSPYEHGGSVVADSFAVDVKHLLSMQYSAVANRLLAQRDVLRGPEDLHGEIGTKLPEIRARAARFPDGRSRADVTDFPEVAIEKPLRKGRDFTPPRRALLPAWALKALGKQALRPVKDTARKHPQGQVAHQDARWWRLAGYDSALVSNAAGSKTSWYQRDPETFRRQLAEASRNHAELLRRWPELQERFRAQAAQLTSFEAWERTFAENPAPVRPGKDEPRAEQGSPTA